MEKSIDRKELKTTSGKDYLDKDFSAELNYKLWTTKGARFTASRRLKESSKLSSYAIGFLTAYIIIINLISVFNIETISILTPQALAFITTGLSILVLVFSQLESANEYRLRAEKFHDCALEIGDLYNDLRYIKTTLKDHDEINKESRRIADKYGLVLRKYENHAPIDFDYFKTTKAEYFLLNSYQVFWIRTKFYFKTKAMYHLLIISPIVLMVIGIIMHNSK